MSGQRDIFNLAQLYLKFITWTPLASFSSPAYHPGPASPLSLVLPYQRQQLEVRLGHHYHLGPEHHGAGGVVFNFCLGLFGQNKCSLFKDGDIKLKTNKYQSNSANINNYYEIIVHGVVVM